MKRKATWGSSAVLILVTLFIGMRAAAGPQANVEKPKSVEQGSSVVLQITTDTAPSVGGTVAVQVMPPEGGMPLSASAAMPSGKTVSISLTVPLNAATGTWRIMRVIFHPSAGGPDKDLTPDGSLTFRVMPHGSVVLPSRASIAIQ